MSYYFPRNNNGKLAREFHRDLYRDLGYEVVMRLKEPPPNWKAEKDHKLVVLKVKHQRLVFDIPATGEIRYWIDREVAPTKDYPHLVWKNHEKGILTQDNKYAVLKLARDYFLDKIDLKPIEALPYHLGEVTDLRWFKVASVGASSKGCRITDAEGNVVNIKFEDIAQGTPSSGVTGYLDTTGKWWFWSLPARSIFFIRKVGGSLL